MKKKLLFMISSLNIGGVEKSLLSLLSVLPAEKVDVTVLVLEKKGGFLEQLPAWVKVEEAKWFPAMKPLITDPPQHIVKGFAASRQYGKIVPFVLSYLAAKYAERRDLFYRAVFHDVPPLGEVYDVAVAYQGPTDVIDYYVAHKVNARRKVAWVHFDVSKFPVNAGLYTRLYRSFHKIYVVSEEARRRLIQHIPIAASKAETFLNFVAKETIHSLAQEPAELERDYPGTKIVTVGRLSKEKGQDLAIRVLSRLRKEGYEVRWYCVGEGGERAAYEQLIEILGLQRHFRLLGATSNPYPYIAEADLYVQTSRHEGFCLTLAEAKCLHRPIVTTDFAGAREQLEDGYNGLIADCSEDALYEKVKHLLDHPAAQEALIRHLRESDASAQRSPMLHEFE